MNITIIGIGYVGLSLAVLISQKHNVIALDIDEKKVNQINKRISPISDSLISDYLKNKNLNLSGSTEFNNAYLNCDYAVICTPTNYDPNTNSFDVSSINSVISEILKVNKLCTIIIKSTIPIGFTNECRVNFKKDDIYFSPEFLREGAALHDNIYPSRIVVGGYSDKASKFGKLLQDLSENEIDQTPLELMESNEAEAVKLFANTYLAMRIAYFNELDSFCESKGLSTERVIKGISQDPRIGNYYNNPSFGYGGYCLPKDTQQLLKSFDGVPNNLIKAVVNSNNTRRDFIVQNIISKKPKIVGVYRLIMKQSSDNFRSSAIQNIMNMLIKSGIKIVIFEPDINDNLYLDIEVQRDLSKFLLETDLIIANRNSTDLDGVQDKVYTRDIFNNN